MRRLIMPVDACVRDGLAALVANRPTRISGAMNRLTVAALPHAGDVLMAGAFLQPDPQDGYLRTMAVCRSQQAAERFVAGDPFVRNGTVLTHRIRAWANMFAH
jgi:uncharacterized protein YciI